jgi:chromosome segregation ATPase
MNDKQKYEVVSDFQFLKTLMRKYARSPDPPKLSSPGNSDPLIKYFEPARDYQFLKDQVKSLQLNNQELAQRLQQKASSSSRNDYNLSEIAKLRE